VGAKLPDSGIDLRNAVEAFENQLIRQALERTNWNKKQAAGLLGLNRTTLVEMLKRKRIAARLPDAGIDLRNAVDTFENQLIRQALERTQWNKKQAAGLLGLNRTTLVEMLKRKRITRAA
jgi:DNA-binding NtrC family response regulator